MEDRRLIELLCEGDPLSFEILFQKYYVRFYNFVFNLTKSSQAAEDIIQNVFMKIWINRRKLHPDQAIHNYIYVLSKREMLNHIRDRKAYVQVEKLVMAEQPVEEITDQNLNLKELDDRIRKFISEMPEQRRKAFLLSRYRGMSHSEIAEVMGLSVRTVDRHINLALSSLKKEFMNIK